MECQKLSRKSPEYTAATFRADLRNILYQGSGKIEKKNTFFINIYGSKNKSVIQN